MIPNSGVPAQSTGLGAPVSKTNTMVQSTGIPTYAPTQHSGLFHHLYYAATLQRPQAASLPYMMGLRAAPLQFAHGLPPNTPAPNPLANVPGFQQPIAHGQGPFPFYTSGPSIGLGEALSATPPSTGPSFVFQPSARRPEMDERMDMKRRKFEDPSAKRCKGFVKFGKRKGQPCEWKVCDPRLDYCRHHLPSGVTKQKNQARVTDNRTYGNVGWDLNSNGVESTTLLTQSHAHSDLSVGQTAASVQQFVEPVIDLHSNVPQHHATRASGQSVSVPGDPSAFHGAWSTQQPLLPSLSGAQPNHLISSGDMGLFDVSVPRQALSPPTPQTVEETPLEATQASTRSVSPETATPLSHTVSNPPSSPPAITPAIDSPDQVQTTTLPEPQPEHSTSSLLKDSDDFFASLHPTTQELLRDLKTKGDAELEAITARYSTLEYQSADDYELLHEVLRPLLWADDLGLNIEDLVRFGNL